MKRPRFHIQFLRYGLVGLISNGALYLGYLGLTRLGLGHKTAMTLLYLLGVMQTFYFNRRWSFGHDGQMTTAFVRYVVSYVFGYALNLALLWCAVDWLGLPHQGVQLVAIFLVAASLFLLHRYWVFAPAAVRRGVA